MPIGNIVVPVKKKMSSNLSFLVLDFPTICAQTVGPVDKKLQNSFSMSWWELLKIITAYAKNNKLIVLEKRSQLISPTMNLNGVLNAHALYGKDR